MCLVCVVLKVFCSVWKLGMLCLFIIMILLLSYVLCRFRVCSVCVWCGSLVVQLWLLWLNRCMVLLLMCVRMWQLLNFILQFYLLWVGGLLISVVSWGFSVLGNVVGMVLVGGCICVGLECFVLLLLVLVFFLVWGFVLMVFLVIMLVGSVCVMLQLVDV